MVTSRSFKEAFKQGNVKVLLLIFFTVIIAAPPLTFVGIFAHEGGHGLLVVPAIILNHEIPEMPKRGFTCVTISETLKEQLSAIAKSQGVSIPSLIEQLLARTSTRTSTNGGTNLLKISSVSKTFGSPGEIRTPVGGSKAHHACPLHSADCCSSTGLDDFPGYVCSFYRDDSA